MICEIRIRPFCSKKPWGKCKKIITIMLAVNGGTKEMSFFEHPVNQPCHFVKNWFSCYAYRMEPIYNALKNIGAKSPHERAWIEALFQAEKGWVNFFL